MPEETKKENPSLKTPTESSDESQEESPESEEKSGGDFFSPAAIILLFVAGLVDAIGYIMPFILADDYGILDILGLIFVGGLILIHALARGGTKKVGKMVLKKLLIAFGIEIIPIVGSVSPSWIYTAYKYLKES